MPPTCWEAAASTLCCRSARKSLISLSSTGRRFSGLADAQILASAASATIFVVGAGQVRPALLRASMKYLQLSRASVIGAVLTKHDTKGCRLRLRLRLWLHGYGYGADPRGIFVSNSAGKRAAATHGCPPRCVMDARRKHRNRSLAASRRRCGTSGRSHCLTIVFVLLQIASGDEEVTRRAAATS